MQETQSKPKKKCLEKYEGKVAISNTFADIFKVIKKHKEDKKKS
jgi:hypothetical protein